MHGNVPEWCSDWHGIYPGGEAVDPILEMYNHTRSVRGGSWFDDAEYVRSAHRADMLPDWRRLRARRPVGSVGIGFRVALTNRPCQPDDAPALRPAKNPAKALPEKRSPVIGPDGGFSSKQTGKTLLMIPRLVAPAASRAKNTAATGCW
jgi:hypothetical protein